MTLSDRLREEGRIAGEREGYLKGYLKGFQEGFQEGFQKAYVELLMIQLTLRFGALPEAAVAHVRSADVAQLDRWIDRVLTAPTLEELLDAD